MLDLRLMQGQSGDKGNLFLRKPRAHGRPMASSGVLWPRLASAVPRELLGLPLAQLFHMGPGRSRGQEVQEA